MLVFCTCILDICCTIIFSYKFFDFFWNVFNSKAIKICLYPYGNIYNKLLLICNHQEILYMLNPLLQVNYFLNKNH